MFQVLADFDGNVLFAPVGRRDGPPLPRQPNQVRPRRPRGPRQPIIVHQPPVHYAPPPMQYPMVTQHPGYPVPYGPQQGLAGLDMRTGMKALGAVLPGLGQLLSAFRRAPEKPEISGQPERDLPKIVEYIADTFDHDRSGSQMTGILATTGAVLQILGEL